jgi:hypothetical protein
MRQILFRKVWGDEWYWPNAFLLIEKSPVHVIARVSFKVGGFAYEFVLRGFKPSFNYWRIKNED